MLFFPSVENMPLQIITDCLRLVKKLENAMPFGRL